jgi:hypothetical protein
MGRSPTGGLSVGLRRAATAVRVKGGAHDRANSDARAGRDGVRGFVNTT